MNRFRLLASAVALALPSLALAQGQIDVGRANDSNNRVGSGGRNGQGLVYGANSNYVVNNGNRIVTGNVTMGREFRDNVGYVDPWAFRGTTAGATSDNFIKNSSGVPMSHAPDPVPNTSVPFYGASQTVQPPPGFQLAPNRTGYVPPPPVSGQRGMQDQRLGVIDLNQPLANVPAPGEMMTRGSLNPQQAAQQAGVLTGSSLYGVREWNPQDPADRAFLENLVNRQTGGFNRAQLDPNEVLRMRAELQKALGAEQSQPGGTRVQDNLTLSPIGQTFESSKSPLMSNRPLNDQMSNQALGASGMSTEQGMRFNVVGNARRTSTQYTELNKRLEQYYADRRKTDADFARDFNADLKAKREAEAKAVANKTKPLPGTADNVTPPKPDKPPTPDTDKPKVKKPQPVKITSLGEGVRGEGLGNVMKRAEALMKEGKFASAMDQYDAADAVTPNNPLIWLGRANAELGSGFFARADAHLHQAFTTDKALLMAQYDLTGMLGEERLGKLVAELKDIANKDATKPMPLFLLAYIAYNTGHERQALGYLDLAEKRAGDQAPFYKMLRDHWALPEEGAARPDAGVTTPKPELNKPELNK